MERGMQRRTELLLGRIILRNSEGKSAYLRYRRSRIMVRRRTPEKRREKHHNRRQRQGMRNQLQPPADGYKPNLRRSEGRGAAQPTARNQPRCQHHSLSEIYQAETADEFHMEQYDFIIDAIDSLKDKADLILRATALPKEITFISSMGAALRTDPFMVRNLNSGRWMETRWQEHCERNSRRTKPSHDEIPVRIQ